MHLKDSSKSAPAIKLKTLIEWKENFMKSLLSTGKKGAEVPNKGGPHAES